MTERFFGQDIGEYENRNYAIYDTFKCDKSKEDFWDNEEECYDIFAFTDYLEENDCILSCDDVEMLLNSLSDDNKQLRDLLKDAEEENERLKESNQKLLESLVEHESED